MSLCTTSKQFLNTFRDGDSTTFLGSLFQCLTTLSVKKFFPDIQPKSSLMQLEAISSRPVTCHQWEGTTPTLAVSTFQILEESNKVSPQPPFRQTKQPQFLQSTLVGHILQALHKPCCPSLTCSRADYTIKWHQTAARETLSLNLGPGRYKAFNFTLEKNKVLLITQF